MKSQWYLLIDHHYFGPYGLDELQQLKLHRRVPAGAQLWQSQPGQPLRKVITYQDDPPLPPPPTASINSKWFKQKNLMELLKLNRSASLKVINKIERSSSPLSYAITGRKLLLIILLLPLLWVSLHQIVHWLPRTFLSLTQLEGEKNYSVDTLSKPILMRTKEFERLKQWWINPAPSIFLTLAKNQRSLFLATSPEYRIQQRPGVNMLRIYLTGPASDNLSQQPITYRWNIAPKQFNAPLWQLQWPNKQTAVPGFYQVTIEEFNTNEPSDIPHKKIIADRLALSPWDIPYLKKELERRRALIYLNQLGAKHEIEQKYQTLLFIGQQLQDFWGKYQQTPKENGAALLLKFKGVYKKQYGTFFTQMLLENEKIKSQLLKSQQELDLHLMTHLSHLNNSAQDLGIVASDMMTAKRVEQRIMALKNRLNQVQVQTQEHLTSWLELKKTSISGRE